MMQLQEITLITASLADTLHYYATVLGLQVLHQTKNEIAFVAGRTKLTFTHAAAERPVYHFAFNIPCNQLEEALEWMQERVTILPVSPTSTIAHFDDWQAKAFYFLDNNGNILECIARRHLNNTSTQPFNSGSLLNISEIGLPVHDVPAYAQHIQKTYGLPYFPKQLPTPGFTVFGDDEALLILVPEGRNWYPTQIAANGFPVKILLENNGGIIEISA
jgi:catechol 2,3-dioxygenase-like lactoylglutathione lyase family enzyme